MFWSRNCAMLAKWINGVQITTPQLGLSALSVSLSSFARAIPSCRFMFIFQLPATIFFLMFLRFNKLYNLFDSFFFLIQRLQAHKRSATVSTSRGSTYQSSMVSIFVGTESSGIVPNSSFSNGLFSMYSSGNLLWLHLRIIFPSFSRSSPGLLRITVFNVVSSVCANGYSAPVMSRQRLMPFSPLAVRQ